MVRTIERICASLCLLVVAGSAAFVAYDLHQTQVRARTSLDSLTKVSGSLTSTLDAVNRPCGTGVPCGLLAETNKTLVKVQDISVTTQRQVMQTDKLVNSASAAVTSSAGSIARVADAATVTARQATTTLAVAQTSIADLQPLESASTQSVRDFDALVTSPDWLAALHHVNGMTASGDEILADGRKVTDKVTADYLAPKPWYRKVTGRIGDAIDITAAIARQVP